MDKEALHVLVDITPEGNKEALDFRLYPTKSAENYEKMLHDIKDRGITSIGVLLSDGISGLTRFITSFPVLSPSAAHCRTQCKT